MVSTKSFKNSANLLRLKKWPTVQNPHLSLISEWFIVFDTNNRCRKRIRRVMLYSPCQKSRGRRYAPLDRLRTAQPLQEGGASLCAQPSGRARNPLGDGHLQSSALSFVGGDHPDRHPPHFAPSDRRSPPRLPRDFRHGLFTNA